MLGGIGKRQPLGLVCIGRVSHGVLLLKSIVEYCETMLNFMQIMPHWILRLGVGRVEEDREVMIKNIYIYELVLYFKQETKHSLSGL